MTDHTTLLELQAWLTKHALGLSLAVSRTESNSEPWYFAQLCSLRTRTGRTIASGGGVDITAAVAMAQRDYELAVDCVGPDAPWLEPEGGLLDPGWYRSDEGGGNRRGPFGTREEARRA